jgi:hypothetical protein
MSRAGFYSDNALRSYPFVVGHGGIDLLSEVFVDFGCIMGPEAQFEYGVHKVWLYRISRVDTTFTFEFKCDAPGLQGRSLVFQFDETDAEYTTRYATDDIALGSSAYWSGSSETCQTDVRWEGYVVVGKVLYAAYSLSEYSTMDNGVILWRGAFEGLEWRTGDFILEERLPGGYGESIADEAGLTVVEPALIQNLGGTYVQKIGLANKARTIVTATESCSNVDTRDAEEIFVNEECITGDVKLKQGYNCAMLVNQAENSITISANVGAGEGEPCAEIPLYTSETSPDNGALLSGGPQCKDVIKSINGISGRTIQLVGGLGVRVETAAEPHTIIVIPDHNGMALCGYVSSSSIGGA